MAETTPDWIAADWGTSHLRLWLMSDTGRVLDRRSSDQGMGRLTRDGYAPVLNAALADVLPASGRLPVICCGMAGSRQGWAEAPYAAVPCAPPGAPQATRITCDHFDVHILPGIKQTAPADVMRGEETQIAGLLAATPGFDGIACLPGTHTKWAHLSAGEVVSFRTFMTGEMFALLSDQSVLRHSVQGPGWDDAAFDEAVSDAISTPANVAARLFGLRAAALLEGLSADTARARLSGLLIGMELAASRPYWLGQPVRIVGEDGIGAAYLRALQAQGAEVATTPAQDITLKGLTAAYAQLKDTTA
ncbi:2-dehydro-3-deoxygalactonokinase [Pseudoponticoccus marisrubri]|uniref:2-keto-3-deoxy-galactonokinase n=1 Tax=Pseudoponticoccus marisrubri TaxID=1685382 RepID=A0A0W7WGR6_9RHOB|nr:2-dehydro-3-deoxygalactonokinase [Pseudoponticoccus marisrubri]KUF09762.1 2-keto-3-deoxy-galactonokinase [Pseudoponticoccus marisrubri]